jgi:tetratricopeptide (TPR) repeat protein
MPSAGSLVAPHVSLCLIVKNEEQNLPACLESAADLVNEIGPACGCSDRVAPQPGVVPSQRFHRPQTICPDCQLPPCQGQLEEALAACRQGRRVCPDDAELLFGEALLRRDRHDLEGAAACLEELLASRPGTHFASVDAGLRGYKARQNLGVIYYQQAKRAEAETQWRAVVAERPDFVPAWVALGDLYLDQQRWPDLEDAARRLEGQPRGRREAGVLTARAQLARREFTAARQQLEPVIAEHPQALWPRVILSHVLLQEDLDLAAAERALCHLLALDPNQVEARNNLAVLLRERQRRVADAAFASDPVVGDP